MTFPFDQNLFATLKNFNFHDFFRGVPTLQSKGYLMIVSYHCPANLSQFESLKKTFKGTFFQNFAPINVTFSKFTTNKNEFLEACTCGPHNVAGHTHIHLGSSTPHPQEREVCRKIAATCRHFAISKISLKCFCVWGYRR